jgi:sugar lactone lactonase YvrE
MTTAIRILPDHAASLGESPLWDDRAACFFWVDIKGGYLHQFDPTTTVHNMAKTPETVSCLGLKPSGGLVMAGRSGIWAIDNLNDTPECIIKWPALPDDMRTNDGKVGPDGAFWVSTMQDRDDRGPSGVIMRIAPDGTITTPLTGFTTPNGIAWSPDGRRMYLCDTRALWVEKIDFEPATGRLGARRRFVTFDGTHGKPDGATVDSAGTYWVAAPYGNAVHGFSPTGNQIATISVPTLMPTMPCLGGLDLTQMFITSLAKSDSPDSGSGGVFTVQLAVGGLPAYRFGPR